MPTRPTPAHRRLGLLSGLLAALCLNACAASSGHGTASGAGGGTPLTTPATAPPLTAVPDTTSAGSGGRCSYPKSGTAVRAVGVPPQLPQAAGTLTLQVAVGAGKQPATITVALRAAQTPCTVASIAYLAAAKFYDSTTCHRLVTSGIYVLQCGDPSGTGAGGPGYTFDDELTGTEKYPAGTLAMANAGPNTNGSQFFIVYRDSSAGLTPAYTVFGTVTAGLDVVQKVAAGGDDGSSGAGGGHPKIAVEIVTATGH